MKKIPGMLEYFLEDILDSSLEYSIKPMFGSFGVYKNEKIFCICVEGELYFRLNAYFSESENKKFSYKKKGKEIFLPYFLVGEEILEDKELLENYIDSSLDY